MTESIRACRGTNQTPKLDDGGRGCATPDAATPALCVDANFTIAVSVPGRERRARVARRPDALADTTLTGRGCDDATLETRTGLPAKGGGADLVGTKRKEKEKEKESNKVTTTAVPWHKLNRYDL